MFGGTNTEDDFFCFVLHHLLRFISEVLSLGWTFRLFTHPVVLDYCFQTRKDHSAPVLTPKILFTPPELDLPPS